MSSTYDRYIDYPERRAAPKVEPAKSETTVGMRLGHWALMVLQVAAALFTITFGIVGVVAAWIYLGWVAALAITVGAVSLVAGTVFYAMDA